MSYFCDPAETQEEVEGEQESLLRRRTDSNKNKPKTSYHKRWWKSKKIIEMEDIERRLDMDIDLEKSQQRQPFTPEVTAGPISTVTYSWVTKLFRVSSRVRKREGRELEVEDLFDLPDIDDTDRLTNQFTRNQKAWLKAHDKKEWKALDDPSESYAILKYSLYQVIRSRFLFAGLLALLRGAIEISFPLIVNQILVFIATGSGTLVWNGMVWDGYFWVAVLVFGMVVLSFATQGFRYVIARAEWQVRSMVRTAVYRKMIRLSGAGRNASKEGEMVNFMQLDAMRVANAVSVFHMTWVAFAQIVGYLVMLYIYIGWATFTSLGVLVVAFPVIVCLIAKLQSVQKELASTTDERVKITNEMLQGIQGIKMAAWEFKYLDAIAAIRKKELGYYKSMMTVLAFGFGILLSIPTLSAVVSLTVFAINVDGAVDAATLFTALAAFMMLRMPLTMLPGSAIGLVEGLVGMRRLADFFILDELSEEASNQNSSPSDPSLAVELHDATFSWFSQKALEEQSSKPDPADTKQKSKKDSEQPEQQVSIRMPEEPSEDSEVKKAPVLSGINLRVKRGELVAVAGPVGVGKSSLLNGILQELYVLEGSVATAGTFSYAAQTAWIQNATIRDNILFGQPMDESRYRTVLKACQLMEDLNNMEDGDMTMIGERGINLSGGQRQRVSVARAVYAKTDIVLLDDPLSALDPGVAQKLFNECIAQFLKGRTCILVTNQLNVLPSCDKVILLGREANSTMGATVLEQGRYSALVRNGLDFAALISKYHGKDHEENDDKEDDQEQPDAQDTSELQGELGAELMEKEERAVGAVGWSIYWYYIQACGGLLVFFLVVLAYFGTEGVNFGNRMWIAIWTEDLTYENFTLTEYLLVYGASAIAIMILTVIALVSMLLVGIRASRVLHSRLLGSIARAPMRFFDTTPLGRILQRFASDMKIIDAALPQMMLNFLFQSSNVISSLFVMSFVTIEFLYAAPFLALIYLVIINYYRPAFRDIKRLESISRSPLFSHFSESLNGITTIRAFGNSHHFVRENVEKVNTNIRIWYHYEALGVWLGVRLDLLGALIAGFAAAFAVFGAMNGTVSAGLAGVSLNFALSLTQILNGLVITFAELEAAFNSVERARHYAIKLDQETLVKANDTKKRTKPAPKNWPSEGSIQITDLRMRYRPDTPLVLKGMNVSIQGGERVGIVGRTGSGKSSTLLALMRLVEPELLEDGSGPIQIDGVDTSKLTLHDLRSKISIVPQHPVLFSGTIRSNLDPFNLSTDEDLLSALRETQMEAAIELAGGLDAEVSEHGGNFSHGQRQLLCLARSILSQNKILLLDEATSAVDFDTDMAIQQTIREGFAGCTILTIAHRLNTVIDSDKILVVDDGCVAEFDSPRRLLKDPKSLFSSMVDELGPKMSRQLRAIASGRQSIH